MGHESLLRLMSGILLDRLGAKSGGVCFLLSVVSWYYVASPLRTVLPGDFRSPRRPWREKSGLGV